MFCNILISRAWIFPYLRSPLASYHNKGVECGDRRWGCEWKEHKRKLMQQGESCSALLNIYCHIINFLFFTLGMDPLVLIGVIIIIAMLYKKVYPHPVLFCHLFAL